MGINTSTPLIYKKYEVFSSLDSEVEAAERKYGDFKVINGQFGLEITFYKNGLSYSTQPNYRQVAYESTHERNWTSESNTNQNLETKITSRQILNHIDLPLLVKKDITSGQLRPFLQVGGALGFVLNARKNSTVINKSSGFDEEHQFTVDNRDQFRTTYFELLGGGGLSYDVQSIRVVLDANYRFLGSNIIKPENRTIDNQSLSIGQSMDDLSLNNISVNLGILFPLRYVGSGLVNPIK